MSHPLHHAISSQKKWAGKIDTDLLRDMRREIITEIRPLYSVIKKSIPATRPMSGFDHNGRTSWNKPVRVTGQVLYANGINVGSLSRSGIDTRTSFPNDDVTAATSSAVTGTLVRRDDSVAQIVVEGLQSLGPFGTVAADQTIVTKAQFLFNKSDVYLALDASPTVNRAIAFPDASGTLALTSDLAPIVISASATATAGRQHINLATATYTDPTPSEGAWYRVIVRNGTATVGGTAYATSGTIIERSYHSGAWANRVYNESPVLGANVATFLATPSSANLAAAVTDETGTGSVVFANSPTFTGTPLIGTKTILSENGFQRAFLGSDYTVATTSITNKIPSFSISVVSGKTYKLEIMLKVTGVAGSTHNANLIGSFNLTAAESSMLYRRAGFETENFVSATTPYQGFALFNTTGTATQICFLDGIIKPSSSGTLEVYLNSGSATNSVTMLKGAYIEATLLD